MIDKVKIGLVDYQVKLTDNTVLHNAEGVCFGIPPVIAISEESPCKGEVLFHEIAHAVEKEFALDFFEDDTHTAFLYLFYIALLENGFITKEMVNGNN